MSRPLFAFVGILTTALGFAQSPPITNWPAPSAYQRPSRGSLLRPESAAPYIAITPCRVYDSRVSHGGQGPLLQATPLPLALTGAGCGVPPSNLIAVSVNITVFNMVGATGPGVFEVGTAAPPTTAWINFSLNTAQTGGQVANAGAVSVDAFSRIFVQIQQGGGSVDFTVDANGYYANDVSGTGGQDNFLFKSDNTGAGGFGVLRVENTSPTGATAHAITGVINSSSDGAAAIVGHAVATDGAVYGVKGQTNSLGVTDSAGVYGFDASGNPGDLSSPAGVLGKSRTNIGVRGMSRQTAVEGDVMDSTGAAEAYGQVGQSGFIAFRGIGNSQITGTKSFVDPHPTDASKVIAYVSLEGPEAGTYFRGRGRIHRGRATVSVPESFRLVSDEEGLTVQVTPIGAPVSIAVVAAGLDGIELRADRDVEFYYFVNGVRKAFRDYDPMQENSIFGSRRGDRMVGALAPEQKRRLIANGTYNPDGTLNLETARRLGWDRIWEARDHPVPATRD